MMSSQTCCGYSFSCTDDENVTVDVPTLPTGQQDEHISVPVVIGKYFILEVSGQGSYAQC